MPLLGREASKLQRDCKTEFPYKAKTIIFRPAYLCSTHKAISTIVNRMNTIRTIILVPEPYPLPLSINDLASILHLKARSRSQLPPFPFRITKCRNRRWDNISTFRLSSPCQCAKIQNVCKCVRTVVCGREILVGEMGHVCQ